MEVVTVSSADIARLAGVRPTAVSNWRRRHDDFPPPVGGTEKSPRFDFDQITGWLHKQGKAVTVPAETKLWQAFDTAREFAPLPITYARAALVAWRRALYPDATTPGDSADWRRQLTRSLNELKRLQPGLDAVSPGDASQPQPTVLLEEIDTRSRDTGHAEALETLSRLLFAQDVRLGFPATSMPLAELMLDLADTTDGEVLDPACGAGNLLLAAASHGDFQLSGQELNEAFAVATAIRLLLSRDDGEPAMDIHVGDSLHDDAFALGNADVVVCHPPFGERSWGHEELSRTDPRWRYGVPSSRESELAWAQHCLAHTAPVGTAIVVMPPAAANRPSGRRIRIELVRQGALRAVIAVPGGIAGPLHLWILRHPDAAPETVLMVDILGAPGTEDGADDWNEIHAAVTDAWRDYRAEPTRFPPVPGRAHAVSRVDLLDEYVNLTPARHLTQPRPTIKTVDELATVRQNVITELAQVSANMPSPPDQLRRSGDEIRWVTVDELIETGYVHLLRNRTRADETQEAETQATVLSGTEILAGEPPAGPVPVSTDELRMPVVREGDVLLPQLGTRLVARVAAGEDVGARIGHSALILRPEQSSVDPWFLAGYLMSADVHEQVAQTSTSSGSRYLFAVRQLRIPLSHIQAQLRFGKCFKDLFEHGERLRRAVLASDEYRAAVTDRLTAEAAGSTHNDTHRDGQPKKDRR